MKKLLIPMLLAILAPSYALAQDHGHDRQNSQMQAGGMMNGMDSDKMEEMHERMQKMQQTMQQIKETEDPQERQELMEQHMQSMREGMHMMDGGMMGGQHDGNDKPRDLNDMSMEERMEVMENHMQMMQMMMSQMMEHQSVED